MTADRVWAYESSKSTKALATCQSMYVVATRHRQEFKLFTEDAAVLEQATYREVDRLSSIELVRGEGLKNYMEKSAIERTDATRRSLEKEQSLATEIRGSLDVSETGNSNWLTEPSLISSLITALEEKTSRSDESKEKAVVPRKRMSVLDEIELERQKDTAVSDKNKIKIKEKTLDF